MSNQQTLRPLLTKATKRPEMVKEVEEVKISPEDKTYVILYYLSLDDGEDVKTFDIIKGRKETYEFIKGIIENLDIHKSKIMVDNVPFSKAITIYNFMKYMERYFQEDSFDIEDYNIGDI